jgi:hypothetical protein
MPGVLKSQRESAIGFRRVARYAANIEELDRNSAWDSETAELFSPLIERMLEGRELDSSLEQIRGRTRMWTTPYFAASGYENLKQLGLHLVTQDEIRDGLVQLYENTYARLLGDIDAGQREFGIAVMLPVMNRELEYVDSLATISNVLDFEVPVMRVRDFEGALQRGELVHMLSEHRLFLLIGVSARENARAETSALLAKVRDYLSAHR